MFVNELLETQDMLQSMMDHAPDAMLLCDCEGTVIRVNLAYERLFGWEFEEICKQPVPTIPPELTSEFLRKLHLVTSGHKLKDLETVRLHKNGTQVYVSLTAFPISHTNGRPSSCAIVYRDIAKQKSVDEMVRKSDRLEAVAQLAASVAHEIRNPLTAIKGFVQLVQSMTKQHELYFEIMFDEIERIEQIINEFLLLAKPQAIQYKLINPRVVLEHTITLMRPQATMNSIEIVANLDPELHDIYCEENHIKQLLVNLMKNAMESMPSGGKLTIAAKNLSANQVMLSVIDGGCGISSDQLSKLGEPYYTTKTKGTGLGLTVSQKIVQTHGGQMDFYSHPGEGTTVNVMLPIGSI